MLFQGSFNKLQLQILSIDILGTVVPKVREESNRAINCNVHVNRVRTERVIPVALSNPLEPSSSLPIISELARAVRQYEYTRVILKSVVHGIKWIGLG